MRKATLIVGRGFEISTEPVPQPGAGRGPRAGPGLRCLSDRGACH